MKKGLTLICLLFVFFLSHAQESLVRGTWLMTKAEINGETFPSYFIIDYTTMGTIVFLESEVGTWKYNEKNESIIMKSDGDEIFSGEGKILKIDSREMILLKNEAKLFYTKVDLNEIAENNSMSGLIGIWEFENEEDPERLKTINFEEPDSFTMIDIEPNMQSRGSGQWIFNPSDMTLIIYGIRRADEFYGSNDIINLEDDVFELSFGNKLYKAHRKITKTQRIERLTFSDSDFFTEDGEFKYEEDVQKVPWQDWYQKLDYLVGVNKLVYTYSVLINDTEQFTEKTLTALVHASMEEEIFSIDNIFNGFDRYNIPEDMEMDENTENYTALYPLHDDTYRIMGIEQLETPAGTFECTVLESLGDYGGLRKLWMINDKPGVFAKIIEDDPDTGFGHYFVYELKGIE